MVGAKTFLVLVAGTVIFVGGLLGGFAIQTYLAAYIPTQNPPATLESLTVESYTPKLLTKFRVDFTLVNNGTSDIQISDVKLNGYSNQTVSGTRQGWNGTTFLHPNQTGSLYWYAPCYTHVVNQTMPPLTANPTQQEIENLEAWMSFYNSTFTFITNTARQYNRTIRGLGYGLSYAITVWATRDLTFTFMATEQIQITNMEFVGPNTIIRVTINNTGTSPVTINEAWINNVKKTTSSPTLPVTLQANTGLRLSITSTWAAGSNYQVKLVSSKGNQFYYNAVGPN